MDQATVTPGTVTAAGDIGGSADALTKRAGGMNVAWFSTPPETVWAHLSLTVPVSACSPSDPSPVSGCELVLFAGNREIARGPRQAMVAASPLPWALTLAAPLGAGEHANLTVRIQAFTDADPNAQAPITQLVLDAGTSELVLVTPAPVTPPQTTTTTTPAEVPYVTGPELTAHVGGVVPAPVATACAYAATTAVRQAVTDPGWNSTSDPVPEGVRRVTLMVAAEILKAGQAPGGEYQMDAYAVVPQVVTSNLVRKYSALLAPWANLGGMVG